MPAVTIKARQVEALEFSCKCQRCGHAWKTLGPIGLKPPARCPKCTARAWDRPPKWKRPDLRKTLKKQ